MTDTPYPIARLAYITQPEPGLFLLNLQFDRDASRVIELTDKGSQIERVQINREQLANIVKDGTGVLV